MPFLSNSFTHGKYKIKTMKFKVKFKMFQMFCSNVRKEKNLPCNSKQHAISTRNNPPPTEIHLGTILT